MIEPPRLPDVTTVEELLKLPHSLPEVGITMRGFSSTEGAEEIGNLFLCFLRMYGTYLNLERLEAVTIAYDYAEALAAVDRGGFSGVLTPTQDSIAVGVAMAVDVLRDQTPKKHLVFNARFVTALQNSEDPNHDLAVHILVHEVGHVHDLASQDRAFPGVYGQPITDTRDAVLFSAAHVCWEEYIASFLSANYAPPIQTENFQSTFCSALTGIRERSNQCIRLYRTHADVGRLIQELSLEYGTALKYGAYLLGHLDGLKQPLNDAAPKAATLVQGMLWFAPLFDRFAANLRTMRQTYDSWSGLKIFEPLKLTVQEILKSAGVEFQPRPAGRYFLSVPYTPDTMPVKLPAR
jgi:hypothetical protein